MDDTKSQSSAADKPLPTQLEIAESKTIPPDATPTTSATLKRIRSGSRPAHGEVLPELSEGKMVAFTPATVDAISWACAGSLCTDDERAKLRAIQTKMDAILAETEKWSLSKVEATLHKQRDAIHSQALSGEPLPEQIETSSREAVALNFRHRLSALQGVLLRITHDELIPLARPILLRFEQAIENFLREREESDRAMCIGFGLEYQPGIVWKAAANVATRYQAKRRIPGSHAWVTPKQLLAGL